MACRVRRHAWMPLNSVPALVADECMYHVLFICYMQPCFVAALLSSCPATVVVVYNLYTYVVIVCKHCLQLCSDLVCSVGAPASCPCLFGVSTAWILWCGCFLQSPYILLLCAISVLC
jgi:hypothetical protein